jgi:hypothetical protein
MSVSDEMLMAFADDALAPEEAAQVAAALEADPALARKLDRMRSAGHALREAFAGQLELEPPARFATLLDKPPGRNADIIAFPRAMPKPLAWIAAAAACAVLAFVAGRASLGENDMMVARVDGAITARGPLDRALDRQAAGPAKSPAGVQIAMSFPAEGGGFCRVFRTPAASGLACGEAGAWRVETFAAERPAPYRQGYKLAAGPLPEAILAAANDRRAGDPLDARAERSAIDAKWRQ